MSRCSRSRLWPEEARGQKPYNKQASNYCVLRFGADDVGLVVAMVVNRPFSILRHDHVVELVRVWANLQTRHISSETN